MSPSQDMLSEIPMFELMDENERATLSALMETRHYDKGDTIFSFGDAGDEVHIIHFGSVQVFVENYEGEKIILRENVKGDVFGDISLFDGGPRTATAVAVEDSETLTLDRDNLLQLVTKHPHAALDLLTVMGRRLRATNELLRTQVSRNLNEVIEEETTTLLRIADWIAEFSGSMPFLMLNMVWFVIWIGINELPLGVPQFDPYPFGLLTMIVSLEAIFLSCFLLISQNRQSYKDRLKSDVEYQVNLKAELEVAQLHSKVDKIYEEMQAQFAKMRNVEKSRNTMAGGMQL